MNDLIPAELGEELGRLIDVFTDRQYQFFLARIGSSSDAEACRAVDLSPSTVAAWRRDGVPLDRAIALARRTQVYSATMLVNNKLIDAAQTVADLLNSSSDQVRLKAAQDLLNRGGVGQGNNVDLGDNLTALLRDIVAPWAAANMPKKEVRIIDGKAVKENQADS